MLSKKEGESMGNHENFAIQMALRLVKTNLEGTTSFVSAEEVIDFIDEICKHLTAEYSEKK